MASVECQWFLQSSLLTFALHVAPLLREQCSPPPPTELWLQAEPLLNESIFWWLDSSNLHLLSFYSVYLTGNPIVPCVCAHACAHQHVCGTVFPLNICRNLNYILDNFLSLVIELTCHSHLCFTFFQSTLYRKRPFQLKYMFWLLIHWQNEN